MSTVAVGFVWDSFKLLLSNPRKILSVSSWPMRGWAISELLAKSHRLSHENFCIFRAEEQDLVEGASII